MMYSVLLRHSLKIMLLFKRVTKPKHMHVKNLSYIGKVVFSSSNSACLFQEPN